MTQTVIEIGVAWGFAAGFK